jgi:hypothetical protein
MHTHRVLGRGRVEGAGSGIDKVMNGGKNVQVAWHEQLNLHQFPIMQVTVQVASRTPS